MSLNSSSYPDDCHVGPHLSSADYFLSGYCCFFIIQGSLLYTTFSVTKVLLLLPLCILVLHLGLQRWRRQHSTSTAATTSHTDSFTYHMVAMELIGVLGQTVSCCGIYERNVNVHFLGMLVIFFNWYGEMSFHLLTCVERYLAVVHPITYLSLRGRRGVRIRNITIGCVWLLCFAKTSLLTAVNSPVILDSCILLVSFIIISFCSLSVLCALIRPGPGEQGGDRERVDQSKKRAFYTIVAILGVLLFRCVGSLAWNLLYQLGRSVECVTLVSEVWVNLPSLVLPLLFLHRAGMLACCKNSTNSG